MTNGTQTILIVEDDQQTRDLIARYLREHSFVVGTVTNGREMDRYLSQNRVDLIVLDLMLPGEDGLSVCRRLRVDSSTPIIILTAKGDDLDRILGLEMGADDYLPKPFNPRELLARINAVLRRRSGGLGSAASTATRLQFQGWKIDLRMRELRDPEGAQVPLTSAEFDLLQAFCERPGRILTRDKLLSMTRGRPGGAFGRSIDVLVSRVRGKLDRVEGTSVIRTVRTGGYIFTPHVEEA
jgi:two-component system, OmpR family, response regulator